jgi:dCTP deaminase
MGVLTGKEIIERVKNGSIIIDPFDESCVGTNSVDLRCGDTLKYYVSKNNEPIDEVWDRARKLYPYDGTAKSLRLLREYLEQEEALLDPKTPPRTFTVKIPPEGYMIVPGRGYLGTTLETIGTTDLVPHMHGRSSVGRMFVSAHYEAGMGDTGFQGQWTTEISCEYPSILYVGMRICQLVFSETVGELTDYSVRSGSKYHHQKDPVASLIYKDGEFNK